jgi:hypothetical protein
VAAGGLPGAVGVELAVRGGAQLLCAATGHWACIITCDLRILFCHTRMTYCSHSWLQAGCLAPSGSSSQFEAAHEARMQELGWLETAREQGMMVGAPGQDR